MVDPPWGQKTGLNQTLKHYVEPKWLQVTYLVFWAERITVRRQMGCSPYFAVASACLLLPIDISEATYLQPPPDSILLMIDVTLGLFSVSPDHAGT
jgi:hypothetical protein